MKEKRTGRRSSKASSDWERIGSLTDKKIRRAIERDPDIQATDASFWRKARVVLPKPKQIVTIRLDADLLEWFRKKEGYQTRINAVLRTYMDANLPTRKRSA